MPPSFGVGAAPEPTRLRQVALVVKDLKRARELLVRVSFLFSVAIGMCL